MGIDVVTLVLARKYADKAVANGITLPNTYTKEEIDGKIDEAKEDVKSSDVDVNQLVQTTEEDLILFGGDSRA